jgi:asparagine synthase (glutamine-hydrolysing)
LSGEFKPLTIFSRKMHIQGSGLISVPDTEGLLAALRRAVREECEESEVGVLFSGGLDSTVLAKLASFTCHVRLYTIGMPASHDLVVARETANDLGLEWEGIVLGSSDIKEALPILSSILDTESPLVLSFEMPLYEVAKRAKERLLISGQGADELFGGYARYAMMDERELRANLDEDLKCLQMVGAERERRLAEHFGKVIRHPFLHLGVVEFAQALPASECIRDGERKKILRDVASLLALGPVVSRPKKAAQYGSGVMKEMKAEARRRGVPLGGLVASLRNSETL